MNNHISTTEQKLPRQSVVFFNCVMVFLGLVYVLHNSIWWDMDRDPDDYYLIATTSHAPNNSFENHNTNVNSDHFIFGYLVNLKVKKRALYQPFRPGIFRSSDDMVGLNQEGIRKTARSLGSGYIRVTKENGISTYRQSIDRHMGLFLEREYSVYTYDGSDVQTVFRVGFLISLFCMMFSVWLLGVFILFRYNRPGPSQKQ